MVSITLDRRTFLTGITAAALLGAAPRLPWASLAKRLSGRLVLPNDTGFTELAMPNNLRYASVVPQGVAVCKNAHDVSASILWAREHGVPLVARSGGHSYAGYSTTGGLMIDMRAMHDVSFDESTGIATLGGGARNAHFINAFANRNLAITHGRCPTVGIAGLALGGGIGFNMRTHGLTCDAMVSTEMVTADGTIRALHGDDDLFWAARGAGGGNFGIHTTFGLQTYDVGPMTAFNLIWDTNVERVFAALIDTLEHAPATLGSKVSAVAPTTSSGIKVQLLGQFAGTPDQVRELLAPVYAVAPPTGVVARESYWKAQALLSEPGHAAYYQEKSRFFNRALNHRAIAHAFAWLQRYPKTAKEAAFKVFQTGERVNSPGPNETAFVHRKSRWLSSIELYWDQATPDSALRHNLDWLEGFYDAIVPIAGGGAYQNFIDPSLVDWKNAYHGDNLARLGAIKKRIDPTNLFRFPESIPT